MYQTNIAGLDSEYETSAIDVPRYTKVIALECYNREGTPGIVASTKDGTIVTDRTWRCTNRREPGWTEPDFDYSHWEYAVTRPYYGDRDRISRDAFFIWTKDTYAKYAYCRNI